MHNVSAAPSFAEAKVVTSVALLQQTVKPQHTNKATHVWEATTEEEPAPQPPEKQSGTDSYLRDV